MERHDMGERMARLVPEPSSQESATRQAAEPVWRKTTEEQEAKYLAAVAWPPGAPPSLLRPARSRLASGESTRNWPNSRNGSSGTARTTVSTRWWKGGERGAGAWQQADI